MVACVRGNLLRIDAVSFFASLNLIMLNALVFTEFGLLFRYESALTLIFYSLIVYITKRSWI